MLQNLILPDHTHVEAGTTSKGDKGKGREKSDTNKTNRIINQGLSFKDNNISLPSIEGGAWGRVP